MKKLDEIKHVFEQVGGVRLAYLFGSQASGQTGPLSDYDFAVYLGGKDRKKNFEKKIEIQNKISQVLKTNNVDVAVLNEIDEPEFKYSVITEGKLIFEKEPYKMLVEPAILNQYFDFHESLRKYNLTSA
ncbi:hypothetical protein A2630_03395 [Candidatus Woesebacteria bacterium RIFCSPHIGHO2_01_FULL_44_10]|uniref:Polymerase beta nucleotidyltransferase domain-containing protein n=1 Tax=Candidatus Woesebacteria bacterium RIFCSPLOWO2_01_FULL_44_14 TaxID=1802525 RepID=A0A1F8BXR6_9BACT|nr:MAG: hypothetical protein A2630_03395 [Candidatus Woesebacteria bacterium RIFCSPHIGHO2_01_FULL_44_10]OGM56455.1 MAG: hypothetical protein A3F62_02055 [Candidatus Woesebacteria bacterium RIFCSPHIGHO2_12_FULL_44_11]OGM68857.1 MAG: hypothetical protein A2975_00600 [Candidatus Woesebacteria bacterium RIFCSPLOWO2_01_FULL_44_14]